MYHRKLRSIYRPAVLLRHAGQIGVLAVQEISLVKAAELLEDIRPYDNEAARTEANVRCFGNIPVGKGVFSPPFAEHSPEPLKPSPVSIMSGFTIK